MKTTIHLLLLLLTVLPVTAQDRIDLVLRSIEQNNTTLKALAGEVTAEKLENKTGIYLPGPEVEYNHLWGSPTDIGNRNDLSVSQSFDIPTLTGMKSRQANRRNELIDLRYGNDRIGILLEAKQYCLELIYYNRLRSELEVRLQHALTIAEGYVKRLVDGDTNRLEYNKAQLNLSAVQGEISRIEVERAAIFTELQRLNGGVPVSFDDAEYVAIVLPFNFEEWFTQAEQRNPALQYVNAEVELNKQQVKLNKAMNLPGFSAGFMREKTFGQHYQGFTVGVSIPLWENKNRVRQAKAAVMAAEYRQQDIRTQLYMKLRNLYNRTAGLNRTALEYRNSLAVLNNTELLKKALDVGQISLLEYIVEIGLYYDTVNKAMEAERDFQLAFAELSAVEL